jgi:hypothetical protein
MRVILRVPGDLSKPRRVAMLAARKAYGGMVE